MKEVAEKKFMVVPPRLGVCQECAAAHAPDEPHNKNSLYYQMAFHAKFGRWPTWEDAMAHCEEEMKQLWREELKLYGVKEGLTMEIKLVHIYGQEAFHDEAYIVGNTEGLLSVLQAIEGALKKGASEALVYANDGEGYQIRVTLNDSPWDSLSWGHLAIPYTREFACEKREDAIWPWDMRGDQH